jgi:hypothetical protein
MRFVAFRPMLFERPLPSNEAEHAAPAPPETRLLSQARRRFSPPCGPTQRPVLSKLFHVTRKFPTALPEKSVVVFPYQKLARSNACLTRA